MSTQKLRIGDVVVYDWRQNGVYRYVGIVFGQFKSTEGKYWVHMWCQGQELIAPQLVLASDLLYVGSAMDFNLGVDRTELGKMYEAKSRR